MVNRRVLSRGMPNQRSEQGYDRLAPYYQWIERRVFGNQLQNARTVLLDQLPDWDRLLILGDGDGRLVEAILRTQAERRVINEDSPKTLVSVDQSAHMLQRQRERVASIQADGRSVAVEYVHADALSYQPVAGAYDVIVTPFFLDCFTEQELSFAMPAWSAGLAQHGLWYHVDFVSPDQSKSILTNWQRARAKCLLAAMHLFFGVATGLPNRKLLNLESFFADQGFQPAEHVVAGGNLIVTAIYRRCSGVRQSR